MSKIKKVGTRKEVFNGKAMVTAGGLKKNDLFRTTRGQIKSIKASFKAKTKFENQCKSNPQFFSSWLNHKGQLLIKESPALEKIEQQKPAEVLEKENIDSVEKPDTSEKKICLKLKKKTKEPESSSPISQKAKSKRVKNIQAIQEE